MPMMWSAGIKAVVLIVCLAVADSFSFAAKQSLRSTSYLNLGFLDGIFGKSQSASAYHILLEGPTASIQCEKLKMDIYKKAIGRGSPEDGVDPEKLMKAFTDSARSKSKCPSAKQGGDLGTFGPGQMVPEFDAVVFNEAVGVIHGPVDTQFGSHLIIVTDRQA